jgi:hypothetical protein
MKFNLLLVFVSIHLACGFRPHLTPVLAYVNSTVHPIYGAFQTRDGLICLGLFTHWTTPPVANITLNFNLDNLGRRLVFLAGSIARALDTEKGFYGEKQPYHVLNVYDFQDSSSMWCLTDGQHLASFISVQERWGTPEHLPRAHVNIPLLATWAL